VQRISRHRCSCAHTSKPSPVTKPETPSETPSSLVPPQPKPPKDHVTVAIPHVSTHKSPIHEHSTGPDASTILTAEEKTMYDLVNKERVKNGCQPLWVNRRLVETARSHAASLAKHGNFSHKDQQTRKGPCGRAFQHHYKGHPGAENLGAGQKTASDMFASWVVKERASHGPSLKHITNCGYNETGIGVVKGGPYGKYWVQNFGVGNHLKK